MFILARQKRVCADTKSKVELDVYVDQLAKRFTERCKRQTRSNRNIRREAAQLRSFALQEFNYRNTR